MRTIRRECLDRMIRIGEGALRRAVGQCCERCHRERNHRGLENKIFDQEFGSAEEGAGTALRIFHGMRRFSQDIDLTLLDGDNDARLERYLPGAATEPESWEFTFEAEPKSPGPATGIESVFLKGSAQLNLLHIGAPADLARRLPSSRRLQIRLEMDLRPPPFATTEVRVFLPDPRELELWSRAFFEDLAGRLSGG